MTPGPGYWWNTNLTQTIFANPQDERIENYVTGRFG